MTDSVPLTRPVPPRRLPPGVTREAVEAWAESVTAASPQDRTSQVAEAITATETLLAYLRDLRDYEMAHMRLEGTTDRVISRIARVSESYVSRRLRDLGLQTNRGRRRVATGANR